MTIKYQIDLLFCSTVQFTVLLVQTRSKTRLKSAVFSDVLLGRKTATLATRKRFIKDLIYLNGILRICLESTVSLFFLYCTNLQQQNKQKRMFRTFRSFKERNILFRSFFEFLATYETQKNVPYFSVLF